MTGDPTGVLSRRPSDGEISSFNEHYNKRYLRTESFMGKGNLMMERDVFEIILKEPQVSPEGLHEAGAVMGQILGEPRVCGFIHQTNLR